MSGRRRASALAGWIVGLVSVIWALQQVGTGDLAVPSVSRPDTWSGWLAERDPVVAVVALLRPAVLVCAWYLLVVTVVGAAARFLRAGRLVAVADRFTIPSMRRLLMATAGLTVASSLVLVRGPSPPASAGTVVAVAAQVPVTTATTVPAASAAAATPSATLSMRLVPAQTLEVIPLATPPPAASSATSASPAPATWTVRPGECFWSIAEDVLARVRGRPPADAEIVPYWRSLIEANRHQLADRSNPDLIFAGQVFTVPPPPPG